MPPKVAAILTWIFVAWLIRRDVKLTKGASRAIWIPTLWMLLICTRTTSQWLSVIFGLQLGGHSVEDGSPLDASVYGGLILAGVYVLFRRGFQLNEFVRENRWIACFIIYWALAILWSELPAVAFKRWIKWLGHPIMALVILTEEHPVEALKAIMKRVGFVVVPVSVMLIKYFPEIGRESTPWATASKNIGITNGKNMLGADCLVFGLFFFWYCLQLWRRRRDPGYRFEFWLISGFFCISWWLLRLANSATPTISMVVGVLLILSLELRRIKVTQVGRYILAGLIAFFVAESIFGVSAFVLELVGRDSTLTGRVEVWQKIWHFRGNPLIGVGFDSFWMGQRAIAIAELYWWRVNEAHNGYLETYLNLGWIGLLFLIGWIFVAARNSQRAAAMQLEFSKYRIGYIVAACVYNLAEAGFRRLNPVWFIFFVVALNVTTRCWRSSQTRRISFAGQPALHNERVPEAGLAIR